MITTINEFRKSRKLNENNITDFDKIKNILLSDSDATYAIADDMFMSDNLWNVDKNNMSEREITKWVIDKIKKDEMSFEDFKDMWSTYSETPINEFRKLNESNEDDTKYASVWNAMSLQDKETHFGDEFEEFFDESDAYQKEVADKFFDQQWDTIADKHKQRIKYIIGQSELTSDTSVSE